MLDISRPNPGNTLPPVENGELEKTLAEVAILDPELLEREDTRLLVELGARFGKEVTEDFGTPAEPKWASGSHEVDVIMSYHNGGEDGHTSVGPEGAGVPRNVLLIAKAVNDAAGREIFDPMARATSFYAAEAHDSRQLCGRALLPEGEGEGHGDERLSAEDARDRYLRAGGDPEVAQEAYEDLMATAFNPDTGAQNVNYEAWRANPNDPKLTRAVLGQELTAAADFLGPTSPRGPLGAIEYSVEVMCLGQKNQIIQERLRLQGIEPTSVTSMDELFDLIAQDEVLRSAFADIVAGQAAFFSDYLKFSDEAIRAACGKGIDDLFPGRLENAAILAQYAESLQAGEHPITIWQQARVWAGYPE
jgi:hypothetical protein